MVRTSGWGGGGGGGFNKKYPPPPPPPPAAELLIPPSLTLLHWSLPEKVSHKYLFFSVKATEGFETLLYCVKCP